MIRGTDGILVADQPPIQCQGEAGLRYQKRVSESLMAGLKYVAANARLPGTCVPERSHYFIHFSPMAHSKHNATREKEEITPRSHNEGDSSNAYSSVSTSGSLEIFGTPATVAQQRPLSSMWHELIYTMEYARHQQNRVTSSSALIDSYCQQLDTGEAAGDKATSSRDASQQPPSPTTTPKNNNNKSLLSSIWKELIATRQRLGKHAIAIPRSVTFADLPSIVLVEPLSGSDHQRMFYSKEEISTFRQNAKVLQRRRKKKMEGTVERSNLSKQNFGHPNAI
jgi:hypothetical protein